MMRIDERFQGEVKEIKDKVVELATKKFSDREISNLIVRHEHWPKIKEDIAEHLIDQAKTKRGRPRKDE